MTLKIVTDHGYPKASDGTEPWAFEAFKNERDYLAQGSHSRTTVAAMDWAADEIERLRAALRCERATGTCVMVHDPERDPCNVDNCDSMRAAYQQKERETK